MDAEDDATVQGQPGASGDATGVASERATVTIGAVGCRSADGPAVAVTFGDGKPLLLLPGDARAFAAALEVEAARGENIAIMAAAMAAIGLSERTIGRALAAAYVPRTGAGEGEDGR